MSEIIATEAALGYVIRGRNNRFECCKASRIILLLDENAEHAGDMMAAGFCLDADDEEFEGSPGIYKCEEGFYVFTDYDEAITWYQDVYGCAVFKESSEYIKNEKALYGVDKLIDLKKFNV